MECHFTNFFLTEKQLQKRFRLVTGTLKKNHPTLYQQAGCCKIIDNANNAFLRTIVYNIFETVTENKHNEILFKGND